MLAHEAPDYPPHCKFALHCQIFHPIYNIPDPEAVVNIEVKPLQKAYKEIYKSDISTKVTVITIMRGSVVEVPNKPGLYMHVTMLPKFAYPLFEHLNIKPFETTVMLDSQPRQIVCWNM